MTTEGFGQRKREIRERLVPIALGIFRDVEDDPIEMGEVLDFELGSQKVKITYRTPAPEFKTKIIVLNCEWEEF